jgi:hypothetical protein
MQRNEQERRREPRRGADRDAPQQMGQPPEQQAGEENSREDAAPSFFRLGEFAVRDPSQVERRSGEDKRKGARRIQMHPDAED